MKTILIAGLGNPGKKYEATRHNTGFIFVDHFQEKLDFPEWVLKKKFDALTSHLVMDKKIIILLKPQTFMNLSGKSIISAMKYYGVELSDFIVAHDEIDLPLGKWKISSNSRAAGHNGVQNIIDALGTKNFTRIRLGIKNLEDAKLPTEKYVLGKFKPAEKKGLLEKIDDATGELFKLLIN